MQEYLRYCHISGNDMFSANQASYITCHGEKARIWEHDKENNQHTWFYTNVLVPLTAMAVDTIYTVNEHIISDFGLSAYIYMYYFRFTTCSCRETYAIEMDFLIQTVTYTQQINYCSYLSEIPWDIYQQGEMQLKQGFQGCLPSHLVQHVYDTRRVSHLS